SANRSISDGRMVENKVVMLCDWLPPDFGAVGQYALRFARELAENGAAVVLVGFSSTESSVSEQRVGKGSLIVRRIRRSLYDRGNLFARATWTLRANLRLVSFALRYVRRGDEIRF